MKDSVPKPGLPSLHLTETGSVRLWFPLPCAKERLEFRTNDERCYIILLGHEIYVNHQIRPFLSRSLEFKEKINASDCDVFLEEVGCRREGRD